MDSLSAVFPEIKCSDDVKKIPWADAVVWCVQPRIGPRVYEWIEKEEIRNVSWTGGEVRILPNGNSILSNYFQCLVLPACFITIGKNVQVG